ncbi:MAG: phosphoribosyl-ATP diphosphatase [Actinobacteria bacterium]|nr:phosphoribosyl-ATP diphosphatase [Actinomycetota bacterium]
MKSFDSLWNELNEKVKSANAANSESSSTLKALDQGTHFIAKKVIEEAGEVMLAAESQGKAELAEEISQLLYWIQVLMIDKKLPLDDVYRRL